MVNGQLRGGLGAEKRREEAGEGVPGFLCGGGFPDKAFLERGVAARATLKERGTASRK